MGESRACQVRSSVLVLTIQNTYVSRHEDDDDDVGNKGL